ncbi:hypothetical protein CONCODRAFT_67547 [Conidiobolus coronatus NRRL 28638]|uniref:BTB domain-containing protein n=1 Tax=Conidiobolus coronatus (strain ATCC 28846 / CBS 209.66 / NRRL 28638) TaxID=796925 RepID=A0A137PH65_CONC2|nr:hypothetical protein CONCODRAFT_67547 [Conidiobolus coronatus NRRL 28638]|eukprot:KXN74349.1 hypothetical protein CONCODRAFT_67547 [Conidiobolus coronatus NRRL 28638]
MHLVEYKRCRDVHIEVTSYEGWLSGQTILTTNTNFENLIQSKIMVKTSDIKLIVKSGEKIEAIKCHSNHLCIKSPYFFNLLESGFLESEIGEIETQCSKEAIIPILQYIYTGEIERGFFIKENYDTILEMYSKVCEYEMEKVKSIVEVFILAFLDQYNYKLLVQSTILNRDDPFSMKAMKFIANYFK